MSAKAFVDTNVVLYLMSQDAQKAERARTVIAERPIISVQVLNEITNVARREFTLPWSEIDEFLQLVPGLCPVEPLTLQSHDLERGLSERYQLSVYDAMIVSSALLAHLLFGGHAGRSAHREGTDHWPATIILSGAQSS